MKVYVGGSYDVTKKISVTLHFGIDVIGKYHEKYTDTDGNTQISEFQHWPEFTLIHPALGVLYSTKMFNYFMQFENYRTDKYLLRIGVKAPMKNLIK